MVEKAKKETGKKVLVTGSSGMLGLDLCAELSKDYDVIGLDITKRTACPERSRGTYCVLRTAFIECDITKRDETAKAITGARPDIIIHAAAWTDVDGCEKDPDKSKSVNENGTGNVTTAASKLAVPLVYISTDYVFDGAKKTPYTEEDTPNPISIYGKSKLAGERKVVKLGKCMILRSGWLYGENGRNFVDAVLDKAKTEKNIKMVDDQIGAPTYTKDFARAIVKLLYAVRSTQYAVRDIYHISNKGEVSRYDYAKEILKIAGVTGVKITAIKNGKSDRPAKRPAFSALDNTKFEKTTGFVMRPWQEALGEYLMKNEA